MPCNLRDHAQHHLLECCDRSLGAHIAGPQKPAGRRCDRGLPPVMRMASIATPASRTSAPTLWFGNRAIRSGSEGRPQAGLAIADCPSPLALRCIRRHRDARFADVSSHRVAPGSGVVSVGAHVARRAALRSGTAVEFERDADRDARFAHVRSHWRDDGEARGPSSLPVPKAVPTRRAPLAQRPCAMRLAMPSRNANSPGSRAKLHRISSR